MSSRRERRERARPLARATFPILDEYEEDDREWREAGKDRLDDQTAAARDADYLARLLLACENDLEVLKQTLDEIFTEIDELRGCWTPKGERTTCSERGGKDTALRLATVYNDWIGYDDTPVAALAPSELADEMFVDAQCWVVVLHGGRCADLFHVLNGRKGTQDAGPYLVQDHTHLNQRGHQLVAEALIALGLSPVSGTLR